MHVAEGDVHALVAHPVGDRQRAEPLLDKQGDVAVAQVVDADALDAGGPAAPLYLVVEKRLRHLEDALVRGADVVGKMLFNLVDKEVRQLHHARRLWRFRASDDVLAVDALVGLGYGKLVLAEVEIRGRERQQLAFSDAGPVEDLEREIGEGFVHDLPGEALVLVLGPELHFPAPRVAHLPGFGYGVHRQVVVAAGVVEHAGKLVAHGSQIGVRVGLSVLVAVEQQLGLPLEDVCRHDVAELHLAEERQDLGLDDLLLGPPRVELQMGHAVLAIELVEVMHPHVRRAVLSGEERALPGLRLALGGEAALVLALALALPVLVPNADFPSAVFSLGYRHCSAPLSAVPPK